MNLLAYWSVLSSQRKVVILGVAMSLAAAFFAFVRPTSSGIELRSPRTYVSESTLFVTQSGFPWGRTAFDEYLTPRGGGDGTAAVSRYADQGRMQYLTSLYAELAESELIRSTLDPRGRAGLEYEVVPVSDNGGGVLPFITIAGFATSPEKAIALSNRVGKALRDYVAENQNANSIPEKTRVEIEVAAPADAARIFEGMRLTPPLMLLVLGLTATILVAFVRHNVALGREELRSDVPHEQPHAVELPERQVASAAGRAARGQSRHVAVAAPSSDDAVDDEPTTLGRRPAERWKPKT